MNNNTKIMHSQTALIHGLSHDGRGVANIQNKTTFIQGALPNEKVIYQMTQQHRSYNEAEALQILEPSPERAIPPCQHFGVCGGCNLQHLQMDQQIVLKQQTLLDQLKHFGHLTPDHLLPPLMADEVGYRRKARLGVKFVIKKDKLLIGFREKKSRYLADLESCIVLHPKVGQRLPALRELISSLSVSKAVPQIEIAMGDQDTALVFRHLIPLSCEDLEKLTHFGKTENVDIYLQPNSPLPITKLYPANTNPRLTYTLDDLTFLFHPLDFTQVNLPINRLMVQQALTYLAIKPDDKVLDLFCGIGNFTLPLAKRAQHVTGIEGSEEMVERAKQNALFNQISNVDFYAANLAEPKKDAPWLQKKYDKVLIDPPRVGAKEMLPLLKSLSPAMICYISCNPATLARDAGELVHQFGYHLTYAGIMNMFPHTAHIEAMAIFEKR